MSVYLDFTLTHELLSEGVRNELVHTINGLRKKKGLKLTDRINITLPDMKYLDDMLTLHKEYILTNTLANSITKGHELMIEKDIK